MQLAQLEHLAHAIDQGGDLGAEALADRLQRNVGAGAKQRRRRAGGFVGLHFAQDRQRALGVRERGFASASDPARAALRQQKQGLGRAGRRGRFRGHDDARLLIPPL